MKNSIIAASAVLIGSVAASQHRAHPAFHQRHYAEEEVCTVYTTVYVTASERTFEQTQRIHFFKNSRITQLTDISRPGCR